MSKIRHMPVAPTKVTEHGSGAFIDRHRHDQHQLVYVSRGVIAVQTEAGGWVAAADRAVWIPAGCWHEHRFHGASAFHTVGFPPRDPPLPAGAPTVVAVGPLLRELLVACTDPALPQDEEVRLRAVIRDRLHRAPQEPVALPAARDGRLAAACAIAADRLEEPRTLSSLARLAGASERTLARLFRAEFGMTYPQWRTNVRVYRAMILLAGGLPVTAVAHRCGFATPSSFVDTFRRATGLTPGVYQARERAGGA
ncbi:helix-turn-helix transcriptional regulator [Dactylosporangium aurantiacum]|uniref:Helix-turn-helix transcriptional regulator n=1 Tax=Dactylosporangium aurantiacum TaxID=35754 RepID=A0A9Q9IIU5_9ACTN|nr:helix-turn-helix transcriptional regulator [Dactylosporangium aurantiacum]MDG6104072.1 helix-turn-helix transcriptional regulator [Dactylosporangium aurantiacum]UWZ56912.1 helix-turn-helix transcriptional regulator [Dactylosporangium aurantiacum]